AEDGIRDFHVTGVQTCALPIFENFNKRLHRDVAAARIKLQEAFEREKAHARREALAAERVRLMSDLHDGIAGQLMSIVALGEQRSEERRVGEGGSCRPAPGERE